MFLFQTQLGEGEDFSSSMYSIVEQCARWRRYVINMPEDLIRFDAILLDVVCELDHVEVNRQIRIRKYSRSRYDRSDRYFAIFVNVYHIQ
jgi:hypothetical protein